MINDFKNYNKINCVIIPWSTVASTAHELQVQASVTFVICEALPWT